MHQPIAIIGMSCRLPGNIKTPEDLWDLLVSAQNCWAPAPKGRYSETAFFDEKEGKRGFLNSKGGHWLDDDVSLFDAAFFGITAAEAVALDPQQRLNLELAFEAFENAGMTLDHIAGKNIGVFIGSSQSDYQLLCNYDILSAPRFESTGNHATMQANRISYAFDLHGPSVSVDTACSSSLTAVHLAVQSLRAGDCDCAIVGGSHLNLVPESSMSLARMGLLSKDGRSYAFDSRASGGFGRGEGAAFLVLKPLSAVLTDADNVRSVIRHSGVGQDGKTPGITFPSPAAQSGLITRLYQSAGLDPSATVYVEAHGTGTTAGDPIEAKALGAAFCQDPSRHPLLVGSLKSNIGHLENVSGVASIIKTTLMLERGLIVPNGDFVHPNPEIPLQNVNMAASNSLIYFTRRALPLDMAVVLLIDEQGFGGSNAHIILEHRDILAPRPPMEEMTPATLAAKTRPRIYVFSGHTLEATRARGQQLVEMMRNDPDLYTTVHFCPSLAGTLSSKTSALRYRAAVVATDPSSLVLQLRDLAAKGKVTNPRAAFIFTGQGASWPRMGQAMMIHRPFAESMRVSDEILSRNSAGWSLLEELGRDFESSKVLTAEISQTATTAIQLALVDTLYAWNIRPSAVTGHSSGEIGAAYCAGYISAETALLLALHRGRSVTRFATREGAMAAIGASEETIGKLIKDTFGRDSEAVVIACVNSPSSVTVSGDLAAVEKIVENADSLGIDSRKLTVNVAYHSPHMQGKCATEYTRAIGNIVHREGNGIRFYSSVTGAAVAQASDLKTAYWARNMVLCVRFADSVRKMVETETEGLEAPLDSIIEIGPSGLLRAPVIQTLSEFKAYSSTPTYLSCMGRNDDGTKILAVAGSLWALGHPVNIEAANAQSESTIWKANLPPYPWDRSASARFWHSSAMALKHLHPQHRLHPLLGLRVVDSPDTSPSWRNIMNTDELPWLKDHVFKGEILFPLAGYLFLAVQAIRQMTVESESKISGYSIRNVNVSEALSCVEHEDFELVTSLARVKIGESAEKLGAYAFYVSSINSSGQWTTHCTGTVGVELLEETALQAGIEKASWISSPEARKLDVKAIYGAISSIGIDYGPEFALLREVSMTGESSAHGIVDSRKAESTLNAAVLDAVAHPFFAIMGCAKRPLTRTLVPVSQRYCFVPRYMLERPIGDLETIGYVEHVSQNTHAATYSYRARDLSGVCTDPELVVRGIELVPYGIAQESHTTGSSGIHWKSVFCPAISLYTPQEYSSLERLTGDTAEFRSDLTAQEEASYMFAATAKESLTHGPIREFLSRYMTMTPKTDCKINESVKGPGNAFGDLVNRIGAILIRSTQEPSPSILNLDHDGLLTAFFHEFPPLRAACTQIAWLVESMMNENPILSILDLTDRRMPITKSVLQAIRRTPRRGDQLKTYHLMAHPDMLADKKAELSDWDGIVECRPFNPNLDLLTQGIQRDSYDLIIASGIGLARPTPLQYLTTIKTLLTPHGRLVTIEQTNAETTLAAIPLSLVALDSRPGTATPAVASDAVKVNKLKDAGLWDSTQSSASGDLTPTPAKFELVEPIGVCEWERLFKASGFSGLAGSCHDLVYEDQHRFSVLISMPTPIIKDVRCPWSAAVIVQSESGAYQSVVDQLQSQIASRHRIPVSTIAFDRLQEIDASVLYIFMDFKLGSILGEIDAADFESMKHLLASKSLLWVVQHPMSSAPDAQQVVGLCRVLNNEYEDREVVSVSLETDVGEDIRDGLFRIIGAMADSPSSLTEREYRVEQGAHISVLRYFPDAEANEVAARAIGQKILTTQSLYQPSRPLALRASGGRSLEGGYFDDAFDVAAKVGPNEVTVAVHAVGVNFKDVLLALGQVPEGDIGAECSGVITEIGADVSSVAVGDRVCGIGKGCFATHLRTREISVAKMPDWLSFVDAAAIPIAYCTAYHAMVTVGRLAHYESVLIHAAAGALGQAAISIARHIGATIYCTVGSETKRHHLAKTFGISPSNIFQSRNKSFRDAIMCSTGGRGVDVVLNSLSGDLLQATWECVAPFGRFLEVGKRDILTNTQLDMRQFERNVSFAAIDLTLIADDRPFQIWKPLFEEVMRLTCAAPKSIPLIQPVNVCDFSAISRAFRDLGAGRTIGKIVAVPRLGEQVLANAKPLEKASFVTEASYIIAGGGGGIGRELCRWMASCGAQHIVLPSRNAVPSKEVLDLQHEMLQQHKSRIHHVQCDLGDSNDVVAMIKRLEEDGIPTVRGLIHGAMVLKDVIFERMTFRDWIEATRPKVNGAWNLHKALLHIRLDFFIMLSSSSYVAGNRFQANYAAAGGFLEGLCHYRRAMGLKADVLKLGIVEDVGVLARNKGKVEALLRGGVAQITITSQMVQTQCHASMLGAVSSNPMIGTIVQPADGLVPFWIKHSTFVHMQTATKAQVSSTGSRVKISELLKHVNSSEGKMNVLREGLLEALSPLLLVSPGEIQLKTPLSSQGLDSLVAVEFRTWIWRNVGVRVQAVDLLADVTLEELVKKLLG